MAFLDDIQKAKNELEDTKARAIGIIVDYFQEQFESPEFEEALKKKLIRAMKNNCFCANITVEYWYSYSSYMRFSIITCCDDWEFDGRQSHGLFEGLNVYSYNEEIASAIVRALSKKLRTLGLTFNVINKTDENYGKAKYVYNIKI